MTQVIHGSFTIERIYDASPARLFKAFADPDAKARWFAGPEGWKEIYREVDFRVGGQEIWHGAFPNGVETKFVARYHVIEPERRLIYAYDMYAGGEFLSVSLATLEFTPQGARTALRFTEHGAFVNGDDGNENRREGTAYLLDQIAANLPD